jgi:hypothetical protein
MRKSKLLAKLPISKRNMPRGRGLTLREPAFFEEKPRSHITKVSERLSLCKQISFCRARRRQRDTKKSFLSYDLRRFSFPSGYCSYLGRLCSKLACRPLHPGRVNKDGCIKPSLFSIGSMAAVLSGNAYTLPLFPTVRTSIPIGSSLFPCRDFLYRFALGISHFITSPLHVTPPGAPGRWSE